MCNDTLKDHYILADNAEKAISKIETQALHFADNHITYPIVRTGYYCVGTFAPEPFEYQVVVEFRNAYGELPAAQIAKLPFYGGLTIVYAVVGAFWAFLYFQNRHDILPVQNYITAILVFLVIEMFMTWLFYDYQNRHGSNLGTNVLMIIVSILNAGRNSFSFFLLLIVCMGYGVVKPSLGKTMVYVRWLAAAHFLFGVIYAIASLTVHPDDAGPLVLLVILPLSATLTGFYIWTLNSLSMTTKDLVDRKQHVKALMYRRLWWCILGSILVIFAFFFFNSFAFAGVGNEDFAPTHWMTRWFVLDGWLNIVYLADVCFVAYLWRPTANNRRFAMSDEVSLFNWPYYFVYSMLTHIRLLKMMMDSKSPPFAILWMRRKEGRGHRARNPHPMIQLLHVATRTVILLPCQLQGPPDEPRCLGKAWTEKQYLPLAMKINGVTMMLTRMRGKT